ncbi:uncharacterized protein VTP21DRAFT_4567 [Calcarisporiella thermophila]|uniref:uncharacterized protein n=1 Tax=Calcarisporiella thermophila TaxID=911321 RepID=UPI003743E067
MTLRSLTNDHLNRMVLQTFGQFQGLPAPQQPSAPSRRDPRLRDPRLQRAQVQSEQGLPTPPPPPPPPSAIPGLNSNALLNLSGMLSSAAPTQTQPTLPSAMFPGQMQEPGSLAKSEYGREVAGGNLPNVPFNFPAQASTAPMDDMPLPLRLTTPLESALARTPELAQSQPPPPPPPSQDEITPVPLQVIRLQPVELKPAEKLSPETCRRLLLMALERILDAEPPFEMQNHPVRRTWMILVARLVSRGLRREENAGDVKGDEDAEGGTGQSEEVKSGEAMTDPEVRDMLLKFILEDLRERWELGLLWLYEEWYLWNCEMNEPAGEEGGSQASTIDARRPSGVYKWLLKQLLEGVLNVTESFRMRLIPRFLMEIPELGVEELEMVSRIVTAGDQERMQLGIGTLRDLVDLRPPVRKECLRLLLGHCLDENRSVRTAVIVTVKKWYPDHPEIAPITEKFAVEILRTLSGPPPPPVPIPRAPASALPLPDHHPSDQDTQSIDAETQNGELPAPNGVETTANGEGSAMEDAREPEWPETEIIRRLQLFFALCHKKHELITELFKVFAAASSQVQRVIRKEVYDLIKSIGMNSPKLLDAIREFPEGAESIVIRILVVLTDKVRPSPQLVAVVRDTYLQRELDAKFLIPVISGFEKAEILEYLPRIIQLLNGAEQERKLIRNVYQRILLSNTSSGGDGGGVESASLGPSELLIGLHNMEDRVPLQKLAEAINICFSMPDIFKSEVLAVVLQQLIDQPKIPTLFMVTVIRSVMLYKNLGGFVNTRVLTRLMTRQVWKQPRLWDGFIRCCEKTQPNSFSVLSELPRTQLQDVLRRAPSLKDPLKEYATKLNKNRVLAVIGD